MKNFLTLLMILAGLLFTSYRGMAQTISAYKLTEDKFISKDNESKLSDELRGKLEGMKENDLLSVIVTFADQIDFSKYSPQKSSAEPMIMELRELSNKSKEKFLDLIAAENMSSQVQFFWINNTAVLNATRKQINVFMYSDLIRQIDFNVPVLMAGGDNPASSSFTDLDPVWNISKIKADSVWIKYNLDGTGIVFGSMDTGIDTSHPALRGKWRGGTNSWIDIINSLSGPYDDHGHGTATIGVMVGGDGAGPLTYDIGVAYGAKIICAKVLDETNSFSNASIVIAGAQWMLDPDGNPATNDFPDIINNSWYFFSQGYTGFYTTIQAWRTAGIIPVFCIGNLGPGAGTTRSPGDYNNCIGVGGTNMNDGRYTYTSEGPSPSGPEFPSDLRKPDFSAPGQSVTTASLGGGYSNWSGTSFSSPHLAATVGLMLQADETLSYNQIYSILQNTAVDLGDPDYDYIFGYGRIDALSAIEAIIPNSVNYETHLPENFFLAQNYPNPFNPSTVIKLSVPQNSFISLKVYNTIGEEIATLVNEEKSAGTYEFQFDGKNLTSGVYFYKLTAGNFSETKKMILLR